MIGVCSTFLPNERFTMIKRIVFALIMTSAMALSMNVFARPVNCQVELKGYAPYKGSCDFQPTQNGSFNLVNLKESAHLFKDVMLVGIDVLSPGVGEAVVIYYAGPKAIKNNMVTYPIQRMNEERSCWVGDGIKICAK